LNAFPDRISRATRAGLFLSVLLVVAGIILVLLALIRARV